MSSFVAVRALRNAINTGNTPWRSYASTSKVKKQTKQNTSGQGSKSSVDSSKSFDPPGNVFKKSEAKDVGPGASKQGEYKNSEYFLYHGMSYAEMEVVMAKLRVPQPSSKTK